jgi:hypothetical protein
MMCTIFRHICTTGILNIASQPHLILTDLSTPTHRPRQPHTRSKEDMVHPRISTSTALDYEIPESEWCINLVADNDLLVPYSVHPQAAHARGEN